MRRALAAVVVVIGALASVGLGEATAPRGADRAPAGMPDGARTDRGRIQGRVLNAETRRPLRRVRVLLVTAEGRPIAVTTTDSAGRYELSTLSAGTYCVVAEKDGFLPGQYGARAPADIAKAVTLCQGQAVEGADIALSPSCAISGRVVDESGEPVPEVLVIAGLRYRRGDGIERLAAIRLAVTDDLGRYRLWGLAPGRYFLRVEPVPPQSRYEDPPSAYAPTYYPGARALSGARQVDLTAHRERTIDVALPTVRTARISGTVIEASGRLLGDTEGLFLSTRSTDYDMFRLGAERVRASGFTTPGLPPGDYMLSAAIDPASPGQWFGWGQTRAAVTGKDLAGVVVQMHPGAALSGRVVSEGGSPPPLGTIHVSAKPLDFPWVDIWKGSVNEDGTFVVTPLYGDCLFDVRGVPPGWMVKALVVNGRDVLGTPMAFQGGETIAGASLVLTRRVSSVSVAAQDEDGRPPEHGAYIAIYRERSGQESARAWQFRRALRAPATFAALPPGNYFAFASATTDALGDFDTDALQVLRAVGARFSVREGETKAITVTVFPRWER